jgi:hypothetical protein
VWAHGLLRAQQAPDQRSASLTTRARFSTAWRPGPRAPLVDREDVQEERDEFYRAGQVHRRPARRWSTPGSELAAPIAEPPRLRQRPRAAGPASSGILATPRPARSPSWPYGNAEVGERARADAQIQAALCTPRGSDSGPRPRGVSLRHAQIARIQGSGAVGSQATEAARCATPRAHRVGEVERLALVQLGL